MSLRSASRNCIHVLIHIPQPDRFHRQGAQGLYGSQPLGHCEYPRDTLNKSPFLTYSSRSTSAKIRTLLNNPADAASSCKATCSSFHLNKRLCTGSRVTSTGVYGGEWRFLFRLNLLFLLFGFFQNSRVRCGSTVDWLYAPGRYL